MMPRLLAAFLFGTLVICCAQAAADRKSTRLNSSHSQISYAVFCLKKKKTSSDTITSISVKPAIRRSVSIVQPSQLCREIVITAQPTNPILHHHAQQLARARHQHCS